MVKFIRLMRGYVRIKVEGAGGQRFLNLCSVHGISLWDIVADQDIYEMNLSVSDYFSLKPIVKKTKTKVVLIKKYGLPFSVQKWKRRKVFFAGCLLCVLGLYVLSLFVWDIRLSEEGMLTNEMLLSFLQDQNVSYGSYKKSIDIDRIEKALRDEYPFIIWTSCRLEGTCLCVNVKENDKLQEEYSGEQKPCDLYATVSGKVVSIITRAGIPKVKKGDEVKKGDLLVTGEVPVYNDDDTVKEYMYVTSDADIRLETELKYNKNLSLDYQKKVYTGEEKTTYYVRIHKYSFSTGRLPEYDNYDIVTDLEQARLTDDFCLPLYFGEITYRRYQYEELAYSEFEGKALLNHEFEKFCETLQQKGVQIVEKNVRIEKNGRIMSATGKIVVEMSDGEPEQIQQMEQTGDIKIE